MAKQRVWQELPVGSIQAGASCRQAEDKQALECLADSVRAHGVLQPILVQAAGDGWSCFVGNRRLLAAQAAGLAKVPCLVVDGALTPADVLEAQLLENLHRRDLNDVEKARAFQELLRLRDCSQRELARSLGISQGTISRALALLGQPAAVQELVESGELSPSTAAVLKYQPPEAQAVEAQHLADTRATRAEAQRRLRPQPKTFTLTTPGGWSVLVTAKRSKATRAELLAELAGLVEQLGGRQEATQEDGPRLAA